MKFRVQASPVEGQVRVPGDKSIAHRCLMIAGLAAGTSSIRNLPDGEDVRSTAECMAALGVDVRARGAEATLRSSSKLAPPDAPLDAGNSGTTMRLLSGILAGQPFASELRGDESLSRRPMDRVIEPLRSMGACIQSREGRAPLRIRGSQLCGHDHVLRIASAQVKSALLLAGLQADGTTSVTEPVHSRDHTERLLAACGVPISKEDGRVSVQGGSQPRPFELTVPGDISSAAFFFAAAALTGGSVNVLGLGVNDTRTGFLRVLDTMGVSVQVAERREELGEPVADVTVSGRVTRPVRVGAEEVPGLIDELPLVALLATQAHGRSEIRGAAELRVKESDRIAATARALRALGAELDELPDGFLVRGPTPLTGAIISSQGDHRLAMMLSVAGLLARGETTVEEAEATDISFPGFAEALASVGGRIDVG